jgi:hypothetical protein
MTTANTVPASAPSDLQVDLLSFRAPRAPRIFLPHPAVVSTLLSMARNGFVAAVQVTL